MTIGFDYGNFILQLQTMANYLVPVPVAVGPQFVPNPLPLPPTNLSEDSEPKVVYLAGIILSICKHGQIISVPANSKKPESHTKEPSDEGLDEEETTTAVTSSKETEEEEEIKPKNKKKSRKKLKASRGKKVRKTTTTVGPSAEVTEESEPTTRAPATKFAREPTAQDIFELIRK
jgi:hypothetical protein